MTDANLAPEATELPLLLVVIDDTEESSVALNYACARAKATSSRVALLRVIEPDNFMHWASLREMAEQEAREEANHLLARWCGHLALSWPGTGNLPERVTSFLSGMPVRAAFFATKPATRGPGDQLTLMVVGGSLGASIFAALVPDALARLDEDLRARLKIVQQCRAEQCDGLVARYRDIGLDAEIRPFFDDMPARLAASQLVISRAGASSVAELAAAGRAAILIPFAAAMDDHQSANARQLERAGGGECVAEADLDADSLAATLTRLLADPKALSAMGSSGRSLAAPRAADSIADYALSLAGRAEDPDQQGSR